VWSGPATSRDEDRLKLDECRQRRDDLSGPLPITHFFSLVSLPGPEPIVAGRELEALGYQTIVTEELPDDGYWHIAAFRNEVLSVDGLARRRTEMEAFAHRHQLSYDGWDRARTIAEETNP
jgi:hypothetical protein